MAVKKKPKPIIAPQRSKAGPLLMDNQNAKSRPLCPRVRRKERHMDKKAG